MSLAITDLIIAYTDSCSCLVRKQKKKFECYRYLDMVIVFTVLIRIKMISNFILNLDVPLHWYFRQFCIKYRFFFLIKFNTVGPLRVSESYGALCIRFCSFLHFYVTLTLSVKFAGIGLVDVVSIVVAIAKRYFRLYILICPDEGFSAKTLTEILKRYIHNDSIVVGIYTLILILISTTWNPWIHSSKKSEQLQKNMKSVLHS